MENIDSVTKNVSIVRFRVNPSSETRRKESCMFKQTQLLRKCVGTQSFFSFAFHVVSALRKRIGNVKFRFSATFPKKRNAFFHPAMMLITSGVSRNSPEES